MAHEARLRRRENRAASHLLRAEGASLAALRAALKGTVDHLVVHAVQDERLPAHARAKSATSLLHALLPHLGSKLAAAIREGRQGARAAARTDIATHVHPQALDEDDRHTDPPRSYAAAAALVAAFGHFALKRIATHRREARRAEREEHEETELREKAATLAAELAAATEEMEPRLRRTAATETAHAFTEARSQAMAAHAEIVAPVEEDEEAAALANLVPFPGGPIAENVYRGYNPPPPRIRVLKVWSAVLDRKTCPECAMLHGTTVDARDEFPGGDPPIHPFCRCLPVLLEVPSESQNEDVRALMRGA